MATAMLGSTEGLSLEIPMSSFIAAFISGIIMAVLSTIIPILGVSKISLKDIILNNRPYKKSKRVQKCIVGTIIILTGFDALILGHKSNDNKMIKSVIYGLVIYMIFNVLLLLIVYLLGTFNTDIMAIFSHESIKIETIKILLNVIMIVYVIYLIILYLFGIKEFKKGVNVE